MGHDWGVWTSWAMTGGMNFMGHDLGYKLRGSWLEVWTSWVMTGGINLVDHDRGVWTSWAMTGGMNFMGHDWGYELHGSWLGCMNFMGHNSYIKKGVVGIVFGCMGSSYINKGIVRIVRETLLNVNRNRCYTDNKLHTTTTFTEMLHNDSKIGLKQEYVISPSSTKSVKGLIKIWISTYLSQHTRIWTASQYLT